MKFKYIVLSLVLAVAPVFGLAADVTTTADKAVETTAVVANGAVDAGKDVATKAVDNGTVVVNTAIEKSESVANNAIDAAKETASNAIDAVKSAADNIAPKEVRGEFMGLVVEKLRKYSEIGESAIAKAVDTVQEETPLVVKEFLRWRLAENLFHGLLVLTIFLVSLRIAYKKWPTWLQSLSEKTEKNAITEADIKQFKNGSLSILSTIILVVTALVLFNHLNWFLDSIKIVIAPRVYLIEEVANFIRQVRQ